MDNLDGQVDEGTRTKVMELCGRDCARRSSLAGIAEACRGDTDRFLRALARHIGKNNAHREGDLITLRYTRCYRPLVAKGPARLSKTWCNCSRGWVLEMFETVTGAPVDVELTHSIKRGDPFCRFAIRV